MICFLLPLLLASTDLPRAERLYHRARYEKALEALGETCHDDVLACERLRALIHIALGDQEAARAAFGRMLARTPDASLGPEVSPKVQSFFANVKREILELTNLEIEPIDLAHEEATWVLKVYQPNVDDLDAVTAFIARPGRDDFESLELAREGDVFVGSVDAEPPAEGRLRYYLVARVSGGVEIPAGSASEPLAVAVRVVGGGNGNGGDSGDGPFDLPGLDDDDDDGGLPPWALWTIVGGGAAVVATSVALALVLSGGGEPGSVDVNIRFVD